MTPEMVTRAALTLQQQLDVQNNSGVNFMGRVCGCFCGFLARRVKQPLLAAVHAAAESAEQTTDLIRSSALSPVGAAAAVAATAKVDSQPNPLQRNAGAAAANGAAIATQAAGSNADVHEGTPGEDFSDPVRLRAAPRSSLRSIRALNPQWLLQHERGDSNGASYSRSTPIPVSAASSSAAAAGAGSAARFTAHSRRAGALATGNPLAASDVDALDSVFATVTSDRDRALEMPRAVFAAVAVSAADDLDMRSASSALAVTGSSLASSDGAADLSKSDSNGEHQSSSSAATLAGEGSSPSLRSRVAVPFSSQPVQPRSRRSLAPSTPQSGH